MDHIPVLFEYQGKEYKGHFLAAHGAGGGIWHLMIDRYFRGQLIKRQTGEWLFASNKNDFEELADTFGNVIISWYQ